MRLICPNCVAQYEVDQDVIPPEGRDVQCANCGHNWFQDSIQMFSADTEAPLGVGDPDSDVPPELFNDLEGKLSTPFASARANVAPNPDDLEPEEPRDDFQIEQEPPAPSSRMDQDALDMIREEAEFSSGEKPPAAEEDAPAIEETGQDDDLNLDDILDDLPDLPETTEPEMAPLVEEEEDIAPPEPEEALDEPDDMDEIRRRIMELESSEDAAIEDVVDEQAPEDAQTGTPEDLVIPDLGPIEAPLTVDEPIPARPSSADNPFTRPTRSGSRVADTTEVEPEPTKSDDLYESNIPVEEDVSEIVEPSNFELGATEPETTIDAEIADLVAEQNEAEANTTRSARKIKPRAFPTGDTEPDTLYGASSTAAKDMFPDVDELTSELVQDAESVPEHEQEVQTTKTKSGGFLRGFTLAILFCIIIGALYMLAPVITEYVPQAAGVLEIVTGLVDQLLSAASPLIDLVRGLIG
ncbi:hypothetical protein F9L33_09195 [Amylibacter sp. SFDW26]|uniref:zinc-ribbon domain-containing protein n=1 Tax=Amylibacter sp. SFDW26 TaxID=2652722 RepID=UPI0012626EF2|nr:zinc-ribbon domain-containing protein [Amylibacter sp. SFDW26]KAB7614784.1 hypothetical protein F9L33_09195 [Amylibacter sp. SFDW26]